jgi:hypothetical protein
MPNGKSHSIIQVLKEWCRDVFLVMPLITGDNASAMRSTEFYQMCKEYNTSVVPKPPYSPALNEVERSIREVQERMQRYDGESWTVALSRIIPSLNMAPSSALNGLSAAEIIFGRTFNIKKFMNLSGYDNFTPHRVEIDFENFRKLRQENKNLSRNKRKIKIGSKVFVKNGIHSWSDHRYIVTRTSKKTLGIINPTDKHKKEQSRSYRDVKF